MERRIVEVSQLNAYIKNALDSDYLLQNVWVKGEISNFKLHYSGHMYMSLKDNGGVLRAVMFRGAAASLRFMPETGMGVLARGRISVFPRDGAYQLYIEEMEPEGAGVLYIAFEQLKAKLEKEGLFDTARKKPIPKYPRCIGVATSETGAAIRDILNILGRRWPLARVVVHPVSVQGESAAGEISAAIDRFNEEKEADVLIVGRGGGSQEDLWAFNEEVVARAVARSEIPVISAVGHETDFTICDFVADLRAPTPSAAAELAVPDVAQIREKLSEAEKRLMAHLSLAVSRKRERVENFCTRLRGITRKTEELSYVIDHLTTRAENAMRLKTEAAENRLSLSLGALDALSPLKVLRRGYSVGTKDGKTVRSVKEIKEGEKIAFRFYDGIAHCIAERTEGNETE